MAKKKTKESIRAAKPVSNGKIDFTIRDMIEELNLSDKRVLSIRTYTKSDEESFTVGELPKNILKRQIKLAYPFYVRDAEDRCWRVILEK